MKEDSQETMECLRHAGLLLAALHNRPLRPISSHPDEKLFVIADSGNRILVSTAVARTLTVDAPDTGPRIGDIDIADCDDVLIVMPTEKHTFGTIEAYLLPSQIASDAIRLAYRAWEKCDQDSPFAHTPVTIGFDADDGVPDSYSARWARFRFPYTVKLDCTHP